MVTEAKREVLPKIYKMLIPLRRELKTESLPQIVHPVLLKGRITKCFVITLVYGCHDSPRPILANVFCVKMSEKPGTMSSIQFITTFFENYSNCVAGCPFFKKRGRKYDNLRFDNDEKRLKPLISAYLIL